MLESSGCRVCITRFKRDPAADEDTLRSELNGPELTTNLTDIKSWPSWNSNVKRVETMARQGEWTPHTMTFAFSKIIERTLEQRITTTKIGPDHAVILLSPGAAQTLNSATNELTMFVIGKTRSHLYTKIDFKVPLASASLPRT